MQNLYSIIHTIKKIAEAQPNVNNVQIGDVYVLNSKPDIEYSCVCISQTEHRCDEHYRYYGFNIFYIDRETNDELNRVEVQSIGVQNLDNILTTLEKLPVIIGEHRFQPFTQRFSDDCCGVYCNVTVQCPIDCMPNYEVLINPILANAEFVVDGTYTATDYGADGFRTITVTGAGTSGNYYTKAQSDAKYLTENDLSPYAKKTEIPTVPTKVSAFENDKGYLTEHQSLSGYATERWVRDNYYDAGGVDTVVKEEIGKNNTYILSETNNRYYTKQDTDRKIQEAVSGVTVDAYTKAQSDAKYATKSEIPVVPSLDGYATEQWVEDKGYLTEHQSLENYYTKGQTDDKIQEAVSGITPTVNAYTKAESDARFAQKSEIPVMSDYLPISGGTLTGALTLERDDTTLIPLSVVRKYDNGDRKYAYLYIDESGNTRLDKRTNGNTDCAFVINDGGAKLRYNGDTGVNYYVVLDTNNYKNYLSNYATKDEIPTVPTKVSSFENDKGYLTEHQDLSNYAKKSDIPDVSNYATKSAVNAMFSYDETTGVLTITTL